MFAGNNKSMKTEEILIEGNVIPFLVTRELVKGLLYTDDMDAVLENIQVLGIEFDESQLKKTPLSNVSKRGNSAIITLKFDSKKQVQYLITKALNLTKVEQLSEQIIPKPFKQLITQAYNMTQESKTLGDFFKT